MIELLTDTKWMKQRQIRTIKNLEDFRVGSNLIDNFGKEIIISKRENGIITVERTDKESLDCKIRYFIHLYNVRGNELRHMQCEFSNEESYNHYVHLAKLKKYVANLKN